MLVGLIAENPQTAFGNKLGARRKSGIAPAELADDDDRMGAPEFGGQRAKGFQDRLQILARLQGSDREEIGGRRQFVRREHRLIARKSCRVIDGVSARIGDAQAIAIDVVDLRNLVGAEACNRVEHRIGAQMPGTAPHPRHALGRMGLGKALMGHVVKQWNDPVRARGGRQEVQGVKHVTAIDPLPKPHRLDRSIGTPHETDIANAAV